MASEFSSHLFKNFRIKIEMWMKLSKPSSGNSPMTL